MTAQILRFPSQVADHSGGASQALNALTASRNSGVVLTLVPALPCADCESPACRKADAWAKYLALVEGDADEDTQDIAFEAWCLLKCACIPRPALRLIPIEDIEVDDDGYLPGHEKWKESRL